MEDLFSSLINDGLVGGFSTLIQTIVMTILSVISFGMIDSGTEMDGSFGLNQILDMIGLNDLNVSITWGSVLILLCIGWLLHSLFIWLGLMIRKAKPSKNNYLLAMITSLLMSLEGLLFIVPGVGIFLGFFLKLYTIVYRHKVDYVDAFLVWLFACITYVVLGIGLIILIFL